MQKLPGYPRSANNFIEYGKTFNKLFLYIHQLGITGLDLLEVLGTFNS